MAIDWVHAVFTDVGVQIVLAVAGLIAAWIYLFGKTRWLGDQLPDLIITLLFFVAVRTWLDDWDSFVAVAVAFVLTLVLGILMMKQEVIAALAGFATMSYVISLVIKDEKLKYIVGGGLTLVLFAFYLAKYDSVNTVVHHVRISLITSFAMILTSFFFYEKYAIHQTYRHSVDHFRTRITCLANGTCYSQLALIFGIAAARCVYLYAHHRREQKAEEKPVEDLSALRNEIAELKKQMKGGTADDRVPLMQREADTRKQERVQQVREQLELPIVVEQPKAAT